MSTVQVMHCGHIVNAELISEHNNRLELEFVSHYPSDATHLWLDYGQRIGIQQGEKFIMNGTMTDAIKTAKKSIVMLNKLYDHEH